MTDTTKIERAKELDRNASKDWRAAHTRPDEEVWMPYPEGLAGHCDQRLLLRLNPNFKSEADVAFVAESRALLPAIVSYAERLISALDALAKGATAGPCSGDCAPPTPCSACAARRIVAWWHDRGDAAIEERDAARADFENLKKHASAERERLKGELANAQERGDRLAEQLHQKTVGQVLRWEGMEQRLAQAERDKEAMREVLERTANYLESATNICEENDEDEEDIRDSREQVAAARQVLYAAKPLEGGAEKAEPCEDCDYVSGVLQPCIAHRDVKPENVPLLAHPCETRCPLVDRPATVVEKADRFVCIKCGLVKRKPSAAAKPETEGA